MKEILVVFLVLIIIITGGIWSQIYLNNTSSELVNNLDSIKKLLEKEDYTSLAIENNKLYSKWKDKERKWSIIVLHEELDLIEQSLIETKVSIEEHNKDDAMVAIEKSIFLIKHIPEKESIRIKNIF